MELFEEALRSWEQALSFRSRQAEEEVSCGFIKMAATDAAAATATEETVEVSLSPTTSTSDTQEQYPHIAVWFSVVFWLVEYCVCVCVQEAVSAEFIHKLESLLQRAYRLQEEFEGALGESEPHSKTSSQGQCQHTSTHL